MNPNIDIKIIAFIGNPGRTYRDTRHNLAWQLLECLAVYPHLAWTKKFNGQYAKHAGASGTTVYLKPETFVNRSGECVGATARFFKVEVSSVLVVHDDLELPFGTIRLKIGGGTGGHNGLKSISNGLGSGDYPRLRLGIGRPARGSVSSYVLSRFNQDEEAVLGSYIEGAVSALESVLNGTYQHGQSAVPLV